MKNTRIKGGILVGALAAGTLAGGAIGGAPRANATCASFFGIANSAECRSSFFSVAIAIGDGATASALGAFSAALSIGNGAAASSVGTLDTTLAIGPDSQANAQGTFCSAVAVGGAGGLLNARAQAGVEPAAFGNTAITIGNGSFAGANLTAGAGSTSLAFNLGDGNHVEAFSNFSTALNVGGHDNNVLVIGFGNLSFALGGSGNRVQAASAPLAIAGSIFQTGKIIEKYGIGFNINGLVIPPAPAPASTTARTGRNAARVVTRAAAAGNKQSTASANRIRR